MEPRAVVAPTPKLLRRSGEENARIMSARPGFLRSGGGRCPGGAERSGGDGRSVVTGARGPVPGARVAGVGQGDGDRVVSAAGAFPDHQPVPGHMVPRSARVRFVDAAQQQ